MAQAKLIVGGDIEDDAAAFLDAWKKSERGARVRDKVVAFESWEALAGVMTGERYRLLRHLHEHPAASIAALAKALGRQYRRVHEDVTALERVGLVARGDHGVRAAVDRIRADIRL